MLELEYRRRCDFCGSLEIVMTTVRAAGQPDAPWKESTVFSLHACNTCRLPALEAFGKTHEELRNALRR